MAKKVETIYTCNNCGAQYTRWFGKCSECDSWNSLVEEVRTVAKPKASQGRAVGISSGGPVSIKQIEKEESLFRYSTGYREFDSVLGGGIVRGSINLISGDPGIGKSTLLLQTVNNIAKKYGKVLYVSGEESVTQIRMRAERINSVAEDILLVSETNMNIIEEYINQFDPNVVIIDSIQCIYKDTLESAPGTVSQIRECTSDFMRLAKGTKKASFFIVCHVTKEGNIGGPKALEHMVDTVLYFEGDQHSTFRILRGYKNRFGSTNEIGIFEMQEQGLIEVANASGVFLTKRDYEVSGSSIACVMEGTRPVMLEIQALASKTFAEGAPPRRLGAGVDYNRLSIIIAVIEKQAKQNLFAYDIFVNISGGLKLNDPGADLSIAAAILSSKSAKSIGNDTIFIGELSLTGEVRPVNNIAKRVREGFKLGYKRIIVPYFNLEHLSSQEIVKGSKGEIIGVKNIIEAMKYI